MKDSLRQQFERLGHRLAELDTTLADGSIAADMKRYRALTKEQAEVSGLVECYRRYQQREADLAAAREMLADPEMAEMAREEITSAEGDLARLHEELQLALIPKDPDDERPAFLEIRAGTGGDESALFAGDLARMYMRFAESQGWKTEVLSANESDLGGYKELVLRMDGDKVYGRLKFESGGHRVQRVPATESQGRIHTSACTVAVMPEPDEAEEIQLNPAELRIDTFRASAPAASTSTRPIRPSGSRTCRPAWWPNARMTAASTATRPRPWPCWRRACETRIRTSVLPRKLPSARA